MISKEIEVCPICGNGVYEVDGVLFCNDLNCPYNSKTYESPLPQDIESEVKKLEYDCSYKSYGIDTHPSWNTIKQALQSQAQRIKELEAYVSILLEDAVTPQIDELKIDLEEANDKLNAISEMIIDVLKDEEYESFEHMGDVYRFLEQIKSISGDNNE